MTETQEQLVQTFGPLRIRYDERILTPRPWTTAQSRWAAEILLGDAPEGPVLEICSGAGHIGLLAIHESARRLVMVDDDPVACGFARENAAAHGLTERVEVRCAPFSSALRPSERFAVVIADPPWVPSSITGRHPDDPLHAIDGGPTGLELARAVLELAVEHTMAGGSLLIQLGTPAQAEDLAAQYTGASWEWHELRRYERGVLLRLRRTAGAAQVPAAP